MDAPEPDEILTWMFSERVAAAKQSFCHDFWNMHETTRDGEMVLTL